MEYLQKYKLVEMLNVFCRLLIFVQRGGTNLQDKVNRLPRPTKGAGF